MKKILIIALATTALAACQQQTATAPAPAAEPTPSATTEPSASAETALAEAAPAAAESQARVVSIALMVDDNDVAVNGYDPVSFFSGTPAVGDLAFSSIVDGAEYRFASAENKAAFDANPAAYQPQFGGYCAYGAAKGAKFFTDPATGTVVNGKLYFNKDKSVQDLWNKDRDALIVEADTVWPSIAYDEPKG